MTQDFKNYFQNLNPDLLKSILDFLPTTDLIRATPNKEFTIYSSALLLERECKEEKESKEFENWLDHFLSNMINNNLPYSSDLFKILNLDKFLLREDVSADKKLDITGLVLSKLPFKLYS